MYGNIKKSIFLLRDKLGLTLKDMAGYLDVSESMVSKCEHVERQANTRLEKYGLHAQFVLHLRLLANNLQASAVQKLIQKFTVEG